MKRDITPETRIVDMTAGELLEYLQDALLQSASGAAPRWLSTREEMASSLGISLRTFYQLRAAGVFSGAIRQFGRLIHADANALHAAYDRYLVRQTLLELSKNEQTETHQAQPDVYPVPGFRRTRSYQRRPNP